MNRVIAPLTLLLLAAPAAAQDDLPPLDEEVPPPADVRPPDEPTPVLRTPSGTTTSDVPPPPPMQVHEDKYPGRPEGFAVGIGLGYDLPADLQQPNITSVRFRLASGLAIEPFAALAFSASSQNDGTFDTKTSTFGLELGADARLPRQIRGPVDLVLIGGGGLGFGTTNPEGDTNNSSTFFIDLHWGLGLEYWFKPHWVLSMTATNPLLRSTRQTQEGATGDMETSTTTIGAIFEPNVTAMLHLFF